MVKILHMREHGRNSHPQKMTPTDRNLKPWQPPTHTPPTTNHPWTRTHIPNIDYPTNY